MSIPARYDEAIYGESQYDVTTPEVEIVTTGGLPPKRVKSNIKKSQQDDIKAIVKEAFDKMDGTYVPKPVFTEIKKEIKQEIKKIDLAEYDVAVAQINRLLSQAELSLQAYEAEMLAELEDEESLLMLI
jgi:multidrug efflux pump subunit AcrB